MSLQKPLVILPAAGFGTRVGSPEAKELLLNGQGSPLIQNALEQARQRGWPVHVITRKEKTSLIQYLQDYSREHGLSIEIQVIEPSREWPDSVLKSQKFWRDRNLLCLPDTVFSPVGIWDQLASSSADLSIGGFHPPDPEKWGVIRQPTPGTLEICEKPSSMKLQQWAWGLICFTKAAGLQILQAQLESTFDHQWRELQVTTEIFELESFADLTRAGSVATW